MSKLGRNPFEKQAASDTHRSAPRPAARSKAKARPNHKPKRARPRAREFDVQSALRRLANYWIPRVKACAYVRVVKFVSRFA